MTEVSVDRPRYVIVTPVRNEVEYIERTLTSVMKQSVKPVQWVLVNDGSTDGTGSILEKYASSNPWITIITKENRGYRAPGSGIVERFLDGYAALDSVDFDFIVKLDADLSFDPDYFEKCFKEFVKEGNLGIGGGTVKSWVNGEEKLEKNPLFHVRGATKIYRRQCWEDIGGLIPLTGWDTIDEVKANMMGWKTRTFDGIDLRQNRLTGGANGLWKDNCKNGKANYICGYHPLYFFLKILKGLARKPYIISSLALSSGYLHSLLTGVPRVNDRALIKYLRRQQIRKITFRSSIWY